MFQEYVPSTIAALVTTMLVALVVLAVMLAEMDPRGLVYRVAVAMGATAVITACLAVLVILLVIYGPTARRSLSQAHDVVAASEHVSTQDQGRTGPVPSQKDASSIAALPCRLSE